MGNPYQLSPKARIKSWLGFGFPFDRHDWFVDRGDRQVHYVIDYYYNPSGPANAPLGSAEAAAGAGPLLTTSIHVDVRPAVEDFSSAVDRLLRFPSRALAALKRPRFFAEGIDPSKVPPEELGKAACVSDEKKIAEDEARVEAAALKASAKAAAQGGGGGGGAGDEVDKCHPILEKLKREGPSMSDDERRSTQVALNYCMGRALCPGDAAAYMRALEASKASGGVGAAGGNEEEAFGAMTKCVIAATRARNVAAAGGSSALR